MISISALSALPRIKAGDDLAQMIVESNRSLTFSPSDVLVISHKVVSKAEGATVDLKTISPSAEALKIADSHCRDPRLVQVVLDQSKELIRCTKGVIISRTHHGFVAANAGVDSSNSRPDTCVLLPADPDQSARQLRSLIPGNPAIIIADSFSRPWRIGQTDVAIGCAGIIPINDPRGSNDFYGRELKVSQIAVADQLASAADLARSKDSGTPVVLIRGAAHYTCSKDGPGAVALLRESDNDLFGQLKS